MTQEEKQLLLVDLCARLPYKVIVWDDMQRIYTLTLGTSHLIELFYSNGDYVDVPIKPYLRPLSSMTEEETREIAILHGYNPVEILSTKVTDEYIDIILDDCVSSTITSTIWYDEIISSVKCFDYLNKKMFDFRGLIDKGLAIEVTEDNNPYKD